MRPFSPNFTKSHISLNSHPFSFIFRPPLYKTPICEPFLLINFPPANPITPPTPAPNTPPSRASTASTRATAASRRCFRPPTGALLTKSGGILAPKMPILRGKMAILAGKLIFRGLWDRMGAFFLILIYLFIYLLLLFCDFVPFRPNFDGIPAYFY
jgi:hypothetical protein